MPIYLIFGPPGCGKGTQSLKISNHLKINHISTGTILRQTNNDEIQKLLKDGKFVSDDLINKIIFEKLQEEKNDIILDGYPRTLEQAKVILNYFTKKNTDLVVIYLNLSRNDCLNRILNRNEDRVDDNEEVLLYRYDLYLKKSEPIIEFFRSQNVRVENIEGKGDKEDVWSRIVEVLEK